MLVFASSCGLLLYCLCAVYNCSLSLVCGGCGSLLLLCLLFGIRCCFPDCRVVVYLFVCLLWVLVGSRN